VVPTRPEVKTMLATEDQLLRLLIMTLVTTGVRIGEALALTWDNIDLSRMSIRVMGTKTQGSRRSVPIAEPLAEELKRWKVTQAAKRLRANYWDDTAAFVFTSDIGTKWDQANARNRFKLVAVAAGCPDVTPHSLRHATATFLLEEGTHIKVVAELLGHSSTKLTSDLYSHVTPRLREETASAIARIFE